MVTFPEKLAVSVPFVSVGALIVAVDAMSPKVVCISTPPLKISEPTAIAPKPA